MNQEEFGLYAANKLEERIIELGAENVAAFIGEPIQGAGGVIIPPDSYWPRIQEICKKYDILLVVDEVICGFGRTGNWFGSDTYNIKPDIITMAKGISSGYIPLSGIMVGSRVSDVMINEGGEFYHGYTYSGHPVACAVAIEKLKKIENKVPSTSFSISLPFLFLRDICWVNNYGRLIDSFFELTATLPLSLNLQPIWLFLEIYS